MNQDIYEEALTCILQQREQAPTCMLCGAKLFSFRIALDRYLDSMNPFYHDVIANTYLFVVGQYPFEDQDSRGARHHINYKKDITIVVCYSCHHKIHYSNEKKYSQYKPVDKKPKKADITLSQGHDTVTSIQHYLNMPFTEVDHVQMKNYVEGWRPEPNSFDRYQNR